MTVVNPEQQDGGTRVLKKGKISPGKLKFSIKLTEPFKGTDEVKINNTFTDMQKKALNEAKDAYEAANDEENKFIPITGKYLLREALNNPVYDTLHPQTSEENEFTSLPEDYSSTETNYKNARTELDNAERNLSSDENATLAFSIYVNTNKSVGGGKWKATKEAVKFVPKALASGVKYGSRAVVSSVSKTTYSNKDIGIKSALIDHATKTVIVDEMINLGAGKVDDKETAKNKIRAKAKADAENFFKMLFDTRKTARIVMKTIKNLHNTII